MHSNPVHSWMHSQRCCTKHTSQKAGGLKATGTHTSNIYGARHPIGTSAFDVLHLAFDVLLQYIEGCDSPGL